MDNTSVANRASIAHPFERRLERLMSNVKVLIPVTAIRKGMVIRKPETTKWVEVERVRHNACNTYGTHVNGNACFDRIAFVEVQNA